LSAHIEAQVRGDLLVAAAAGVQLETKLSDPIYKLELDEVMNVLRGRMIAHPRLARVRTEFRSNRIERCAQLRCFSFGQDSCRGESRRVRLAGGYFFIEKPPVKDDRALPRFEFSVKWLAKPARPHLPGLLFVEHCFKRTSC